MRRYYINTQISSSARIKRELEREGLYKLIPIYRMWRYIRLSGRYDDN